MQARCERPVWEFLATRILSDAARRRMLQQTCAQPLRRSLPSTAALASQQSCSAYSSAWLLCRWSALLHAGLTAFSLSLEHRLSVIPTCVTEICCTMPETHRHACLTNPKDRAEDASSIQDGPKWI